MFSMILKKGPKEGTVCPLVLMLLREDLMLWLAGALSCPRGRRRVGWGWLMGKVEGTWVFGDVVQLCHNQRRNCPLLREITIAFITLDIWSWVFSYMQSEVFLWDQQIHGRQAMFLPLMAMLQNTAPFLIVLFKITFQVATIRRVNSLDKNLFAVSVLEQKNTNVCSATSSPTNIFFPMVLANNQKVFLWHQQHLNTHDPHPQKQFK